MFHKSLISIALMVAVRPRESPGLAARCRRRFRKEQNSAARVNTNGLTRPSGALDRVVTTGRIRRPRRRCFP